MWSIALTTLIVLMLAKRKESFLNVVKSLPQRKDIVTLSALVIQKIIYKTLLDY